MSYGFLLKNPLDFVQIDDSNSQLQVIDIMTITPVFYSWINAAGTEPLYAYGLFTQVGELFFARLDNHTGWVGTQIGSTYLFPTSTLTLLSTTNSPITLIKCKKSTTFPDVSSGYGLNIYNSFSQLVFSSAYNNVSIVAANMYDNSNFYYGSSNYQSLITPTLSVNFKRCLLLNYLPCVTAMVVDSEHGAPPDILFNIMGKFINGSSVAFKAIQNRSIVYNFYTNFPGTFTALIGDIQW